MVVLAEFYGIKGLRINTTGWQHSNCDIVLAYIFLKRYHNNRWQMSCHLTKLEASTYNGPHTFARPSHTAMMPLTVTWSDGEGSGLRRCCVLSVGTLSPTAQGHAIRLLGPDGGGSTLSRNVGNCQSTRRNAPEDLSPRQHRCNVKSRTVDRVAQKSVIRLIELSFWNSFGDERTNAGENYVMWFRGKDCCSLGISRLRLYTVSVKQPPSKVWRQYYFVNSSDSAHDKDRRRAVVNTVMNLRVPENAANLLTSWGPVSFSGRTLLHGVTQPAQTVYSVQGE